MGVLQDSGLETVNHYAPLHYLPFIARSAALLSKPSLRAAGFPTQHLRSMSSKQDNARGFGRYAFLTIDETPRILKSKLEAGFPHMAVVVPTSAIEATTFNLCRFNVAMTRFLKRDEKPGFPESETNGRYYAGHQVPIAKARADQSAMLAMHLPKGTMIEVLIEGDLPLPPATTIQCYSEEDLTIARRVLRDIGCGWGTRLANPPGPYNRKEVHVLAVKEFIAHAMADPEWRGDGLEFDRIR